MTFKSELLTKNACLEDQIAEMEETVSSLLTVLSSRRWLIPKDVLFGDNLFHSLLLERVSSVLEV